MRKKRKRKLNKFALGGALIMGALFIFYLSGILFVCKQDGGQLVKNNPTSILLWTARLSCPLNKPQTSFAKQWLNKPEPKASVSLSNISQNWGVGIFEKIGRGIDSIQQAALTRKVFAYDQQATHPALTDEAVDFYNLNFPDNQLSQEDKQLLSRGAIEEDTPPRWLNHFYDPIYNKGWIGYTTSKVWAISSTTQQAFTDSAYSYGGFANLFSDNLSPTDFSYERALHDYASGNRKRAMLAMGHVLHLLEDSNVPEHTRGDTHLPWHGTESPYEKTMAKWNPGNIEITRELFKNLTKPVLLGNLADYFDKIAKYSNGYFFSQDTISSDRYNLPKIVKIQQKNLGDKIFKFAIGLDKNQEEFKLALVNTRVNRNIIEVKDATLIDPTIGNLILDDYWARLAPDFVAHGAGALKLFLEQAELVKQEYAKEMEKVNVSADSIGRFLSFLGFTGGGNRPVTFNPEFIQSIISQPRVLGVLTDAMNDVVNDDSNDVNGVGNDDNDVSNEPTPSVIPLTPSITPSALPTQFSPENLGWQATALTPSPTPLFFGSYGGSSGGSSGNNATPTPSPSPTPTPTPTPVPTGTPEVEPPQEVQPLMQIIINEIGWMGTGNSATLSSDEWLELYNPTSSLVDVGGWRLVSLTDDSPNIVLASKTIEPYGFFLLERTNDFTISDISADQIYTGNLNDGGEILELRDNQDNLVDFVGSLNASGQADFWYAGNKTARSSMERIDPLKPGDNSTNWATNNGQNRNGINAAGDPVNGTPRAKNSIYVSQKPSAILDLAIDLTSSFFDKVKLLWSAPKDDDTLISRLRYELRYATHSFDAIDDWDNAVKVGKSNMPKTIAPFSSLQSASFSLFDFTGPTQNTANSFTFSITPTVATSCRDILSTGRAENVPHPEVDSLTIYNTDTGERIDYFGGNANQIICNFDYPDGHYSVVVEHQQNLLSCRDSSGEQLKYEDCKNNPAFEGEVLFAINSQPFSFNQDYYFAIKTHDGGQWSDISNQAEYTAKSAIFDDSDVIPGLASPSIQWTFQVPNVLRIGQPALAPDGTIYVSAPSYEFGRKLRLYAVNQDGGEKWYWENGLAEPSELAVSADGAVYFGQFDPGSYVTALNPDGSTRWQYGIGDRVNNISIDNRGNVYFTSENRLITKLQPNGKKKWQVLDTFTFGFTPLVDIDDDVYIGANITGLPGLYKLNGNDGSMAWQTRVSDNFIYSQFEPVYDSDQDQFFSTTANYGQILTFDKDGGDTTKNIIDTQGSPSTKVTILGDSLVFGMDFSFNRPASGSLVYAVDKSDKSVIWTFRVDSRVNEQIIADSEGNLYFATRLGKVYSLNQNGQKRWVLDLETPTDYYPVLWNGSLFISAGGKLFKIGD